MTAIIEKLPTDITLHMLSFSAPKDLAENVSITSKALSTYSNDAQLWKTIALRSNIKTDPKEPLKEQVLAHIKKCEELNTIFLTTISYLKEQIQNNSQIIPYTLSEIPTGSDPMDLHDKIIDWCAKDIEETRPERENQKLSKTLLLIKFFNEEASSVQGLTLAESPKEIYDRRLLELFTKAAPEVEPKDISFGQPNYWSGLLSEYPDEDETT